MLLNRGNIQTDEDKEQTTLRNSNNFDKDTP